MSVTRRELCPACGTFHSEWDVRARGLFRPQGPYYEITVPGHEGEAYPTREEAEAAVCPLRGPAPASHLVAEVSQSHDEEERR